jgi:hypothetical protein
MRLGYYVEGKFFAGKLHQATAFAQNRANEFSRNVKVTFVNHDLTEKVIDNRKPVQNQQVA